MEALLLSIRWVHILAGAMGLALFWVPIFSRKGSPLHKRFGRWFLWCVNIIGVSSLTTVSLRLGDIWWRGGDVTALRQFGFLMFLAYLAVNVMISAWYVRHVLINKNNLTGLRRPMAWTFTAVTLLSSVLLLLLAANVPSPSTAVMYALSPIGFINAWTMRRHLHAPQREPRAWFYVHMGHSIGLGIAFHTAFVVVGARTFLESWLVGFWSVLPWVAPAVIGVIGNVLWERYYRRLSQIAVVTPQALVKQQNPEKQQNPVKQDAVAA